MQSVSLWNGYSLSFWCLIPCHWVVVTYSYAECKLKNANAQRFWCQDGFPDREQNYYWRITPGLDAQRSTTHFSGNTNSCIRTKVLYLYKDDIERTCTSQYNTVYRKNTNRPQPVVQTLRTSPCYGNRTIQSYRPYTYNIHNKQNPEYFAVYKVWRQRVANVLLQTITVVT